ncbi:MAG: deoxyribonuclease IV [Acidobacteriota bacterium]|nr:deoxyribonuclease IV [Acidobacteriota bacterium]
MSGRLAVGCHLSTSGGYERMGRTAVDLDATTLAFFTRNPRGGGSKALDGQDVARLRDVLAAHGFGRLVAHAPYTMNLCSGNPETVAFARRTLADDLERMEVLPGNYYNLHPGSHVGQGVDRGIGLICEGLDATLEPGQATMVLLETMAGKGSEVGRSFEELARILDGTRHDELLGICLDTCHVSDAGYDVAGDLEGVLGEFDRLIGLERLRALHLNDSKSPCGSRRDRHERLGAGHLGINCFAAIVAHPLLSTLPMVLETPNDLAGYAAEIALLRSLAGEREA